MKKIKQIFEKKYQHNGMELDTLEKLDKYKIYMDDDKYVFKLCYDVNTLDKKNKNKNKPFVVIMSKTNKTKTNESRMNVFNDNCAKFRANRLKVIKIVSIEQPETQIGHIINKFGIKELKYEVGKIVCVDNYDEDINKICAAGIHYFKTLRCAYYYRNVPKNYNGIWINWYDNGQKKSKGKYLNGEKIDKWFFWYETGEKMSIEIYSIDIITDEILRSGEWITWHSNGVEQLKGNYLYGEKSGKWKEWYDNGIMKEEGHYLYGKRKGEWIGWHDNMHCAFKGIYNFGIRTGNWFEWYVNGQIELECTYLNGKENGHYTRWFSNGKKQIEGTFTNGIQIGELIKWNINGEKISETKNIDEH